MKLQSLVTKSFIYYLREQMEDNDYVNGNYDVIDAYPADYDKVNIFPTISVERVNTTKIPYQIGSRDRKKLIYSIDVFAYGQNQKDDVVEILMDNLQHKYINIYNFNSGFPSAVGVYGAIPKLGEGYVESFNAHSIPPPSFTNVAQKKYHEMINIVVVLPIIDV